MRFASIEIPNCVNRDTLPDDHWNNDGDRDGGKDHDGDEVAVVLGVGEDANIQPEDGHFDEVDHEAIENLREIVCEGFRLAGGVLA